MKFITIKKRINSSVQAKELINGSFWSVLGSVISRSLIFVAWIVVGNLLGSDDFGAFGLIRDTILMFTVFAGLGLGITASKFVAEYIEKDAGKTSRIIGLTMLFGIMAGLLLGTLVYVFSPCIAENIIHRPEYTLEFRIASVILFFCSLNGAQIGVLQGLQRFKDIAAVNFWQSVISFPLFYVGAKYAGVRGAVIAFAFYNIIVCVLSHIKLSKAIKAHCIRLDFKDALKEKRIILTYSLPAFISGLLVTPVKWVTDVMLFNGENGAHEMGLFTAVYTFNLIFIAVASMIDAPFLVVLSKNRSESINSNLNRVNVILPWCIGVLVIIPFMLFPEVIMALFDSSFQGESFKINLILVLLFTLVIMYKQGLARILAVHDLQWLGVVSNSVWGLSLIGFFYFAIGYGAVGLCLAYIVAYVASTIIILPVYRAKGLIPANTVFSWYALFIWGIIIAIVFISLFEHSLINRGIVFLILYPFVIYLFYKYLFKK